MVVAIWGSMVENRPATRLKRVNVPEMQLVGWRVEFRIHRKRVCRFFSDKTLGGSTKAKSSAAAFVAKNARYIGEILQLMRRLYPRANTKFSIPGVTRVARSDRSPYWVAYWDDKNGRKIQKKFLVTVYGEAKARKLAESARLLAVNPYMVRLNKLKAKLKIRD